MTKPQMVRSPWVRLHLERFKVILFCRTGHESNNMYCNRVVLHTSTAAEHLTSSSTAHQLTDAFGSPKSAESAVI